MIKKVAIIEDDAVISQMYRMKFEAEGFSVETANNGHSGVTLVNNMQPDVILLDLRMPELNGAEALAKIRKNSASQSTPVLVLTNLGEEEAPKSLDELNVYAYIVKADLTPSQVVAKVKEALAQ